MGEKGPRHFFVHADQRDEMLAEAITRQEAGTLFGCGLEEQSEQEEGIVAFSEDEKEDGGSEIMEDTAEETAAVVGPSGSTRQGLPAAPAPTASVPVTA